MSDDKKPTRVDRIVTGLKNHPVIAVLVVIVGIVVFIASFTNAVQDILDFVQKHWPGQTSCQTTESSFCYATFGIQFPEGAWKAGATYGYSMEVRECDQDNFSGSLVTFIVGQGPGGAPFYLLKDGVFDTADRNAAKPATASQTQRSYAVVLIARPTAAEARKAQSTCKAFINLVNGPSLTLAPSDQAPLVSQAAFDPTKLNLFMTAAPFQFVPMQP